MDSYTVWKKNIGIIGTVLHLGTFLDRDGVAIRTGHHCTMPLMRSLGVFATARASFYLYNTEDEVDLLVDSIKRALRYFADGAR